MTLRPIKENDLLMILEWRNSERVRKSMYTQSLISLSDHCNWWKAQKDREDRLYFIYEAEGTPLGYVSIIDIDRRKKECTWGLYTSDQAPKGTGYNMCKEALDYAFGILNMDRVVSEALSQNKAARSLYERLGFKQEATLQAHVIINEHAEDVAVYSINKKEYEDTCK